MDAQDIPDSMPILGAVQAIVDATGCPPFTALTLTLSLLLYGPKSWPGR